jgi:hypothetical protein
VKIVSAASCLVLAAATTADAAPRRVAHNEAFGAPVFAGPNVVYPGLSARNEVEIHRVGPDGAADVVAHMGRPAKSEERPFVALTGSGTNLAAVRITVR